MEKSSKCVQLLLYSPLCQKTSRRRRLKFIMVKLDQEQSSVVEAGQVKPLMIASKQVKVLGGFDVLENGDTTVLLDFDAENSLIKQCNGQWQMRTVILMEGVNAVPAM